MKRVVLVVVLVLAAVVPATASARAKTVGVKASEFKFVLTTKTVHKGVVVFKIKNVGHLLHDFAIDHKKSVLLKPGRSTTLKIRFKKAGKYRYECTVAGHAAAGMKGVLRVR